MSRKTISQQPVTPALLKFREKRKWQIALRRYVLERNVCVFYAPYFGLDIESIRKWFEMQFTEGITWESFGKKWQFDHIIPVTYFDFSEIQELKLCWNFTNLRVEEFQRNKDRGSRLDVLAAKGYFEELYKTTLYLPCLQLLEKIDKIELSELVSSKKQQEFINENRLYLDMIENYSAFEFELLNSGRTVEDVKKEIAFLKKFDK
jgi:5-methylcytosine-specific restriction endonuclease McrA